MKHTIPILVLVLLTALPNISLAAQRQSEPGGFHSLSAEEEARRSIELMGGADQVREAADEAAAAGGNDNWAWARKLAAYLLLLDGDDEVALSIRQTAERGLAQGSPVPPAEAGAPADLVSGPGKGPDYLFPAADPWNFDRNYITASIADADWTIDEVFPGTKLILEGRYSFYRGMAKPVERDCDCEPLPTPRKTIGTVSAHLQWGEGETGLEYGRLSATALGYIRNFDTLEDGFKPLRDTMKWGELQISKDDPLGIDSYFELALVEGSRTWRWRPSSSAFIFTIGLQGWVGYAWASSTDETYSDVTNPIIGSSFKGTVGRPRWGNLYVEQRIVNGFTLSSPSAGGTVSREARFRAGYINRIYGCLSAELYIEKRSFNFTDHRLDDLYTKSKRLGASLGCEF